MPIITDVRVRQPAKHELVAERFTIAGIGSGFEGTIGIRLLGPRGKVIATAFAQAEGGMAGVGEFVAEIRVKTPPRAGTRVTLQAFGDNPGLPGEGPSPGFDLVERELIMFPGMHGWVLYRVERGDTLQSIRRKTKDHTNITANQIALANPHITDTSHLPRGMKLRIPMRQ